MRPLPRPEPGTPPSFSPTGFLLWQARQQWGILALAVLCGILTFLASAVSPYVLGAALDEGLEQGVTPEILRWAAVLFGAGALQVVAGAIGHRLDVENWLRSMFATTQLVTRTVGRSGDAVTADIPTGEVVATVATDAARIGEFYFNCARLLGSLVAYAAVAVVMLRTSLALGIVVAIGLPAVASVLALLVKPLHRRQSVHREASGALTALGADTVSGLRILRGIGGESAFTDRYRARSQEVRQAGVRVAQTQSYLDALQVLLPGLFVALVLWLGAQQALAGTISAGQLVTFYGYAAFLTWPLQNLTQSLQIVTRAVVAVRKVSAVLRVEPASGRTAGTVVAPPPGAAITDTVSGLVLPAGRLVALVSVDPDESAAVATRMGRFDDDAEAATPVLLGDVRLHEIDKAHVRGRLVVAEATTQLFSGTLRDELDVRGTSTDEQILAALRVADAQDVLDSTPGGLDGELPEKGRSLSGGQRQRVALARALLTEAEHLILVEPTSAVDAHTEARIAERLAAARQGRSTLVVTASPLVLDQVDEVALLRSGVVVARGTHRELLHGSDEEHSYYRAVVGRSLDDHDDDHDDRAEPAQPSTHAPTSTHAQKVSP